MSFITIQEPNGSERPLTVDDYVKASPATKVAVGATLSGTALLVLGVSNPFAALAIVAGGQGLAWLPDMAKKCAGSVRSTLRSLVQVESVGPEHQIVDLTDANGNLDKRKLEAYRRQQGNQGNAPVQPVRQRSLNDERMVRLIDSDDAFSVLPQPRQQRLAPAYNPSLYQGYMSEGDALAAIAALEDEHPHSQ